MEPASRPTKNAAHVGMYPAAGVMQARPATAPVNAPTRLGFPSRHHEMVSQVHIAIDPAMSVLTNACAATPFAASADPALNPNHPNHSSPVPRATNATLCGTVFSPGANFRAPTTHTLASAANPALVWTTNPPAKSRAPHVARNPPPHSQWASGMYTSRLHRTRNFR